MSPMQMDRSRWQLGILVGLGATLLACPEPSSAPPMADAASAAPASQPASQPKQPPPEHSTSTTPVSLEELFAMPEAPDVVAKVGDVKVPKDALERKLRQLQLQLKAAGLPEGTSRSRVLESAMAQLIDYELTMQVAKELGVKVPKKDIDAQVELIEDRMEKEPAFKAILLQAGNTHEQRVQDARFMLATDGIAVKLMDGLRTTTATTMQAYYEANKRDFLEHEGVEAWRIFIKAPAGMAQRERDLARLRAEGIMKEAQKKPKSFDTLAKSHSEGGKGSTGGYLGFVAKGTFNPDLEAQIWSAKPNSILPIYDDSAGFYIYKIGKKRPERTLSFKEAEPEIFQRLSRGVLRKELGRELERVRSKRAVEIYVKELEGSALAHPVPPK